MRICHINEPGAGGSFAVMVALARHAVCHGHDVHAIYSRDRCDPRLVQQLHASGAIVHTSPMRRPVGPWDAGDGLQLRRLMASIGHFDVVHSHSSKAGALARLFARRRGTIQIYSPHGFYTMTGKALASIGRVERALSVITDRIVAVSRYEREHALALGIAPDRVVVVPNGLAPSTPLHVAEARAELGMNAQAFVLGFVGRLEDQKDPLTAIAVMKALAGSGVELCMIGDGALRRDVEEAALSLGGNVHMVGTKEAKPLFSAFDALLCTSRYEGMPVAFLESLHAGVPIVSFPVGGTDELIEQGHTGIVVDADPRQAAYAVRQLQELSGNQRQLMRDACLRKAAEYTEETMGAATLNLYRDVLLGPGVGQ